MKKKSVLARIVCVGLISVVLTGCAKENDKETETIMENTEKDSTEKDSTEKDSTEKDSTKKDSTEKDSTKKDSTEKDSTEKDSTKKDDTEKDSTENDNTEKNNTKGSAKKSDETQDDKSAEKQAAVSLCGALHVEGSSLLDEQRRPVQLRGISTHGLQWYPEYVNEDCFKELHENWNANVIRLAMYTAEGGYCEGDKSALKDIVKKGVEYAANQDMYVIIDWHILSDNDPNLHKDEAKAFFEEMAENFANYNNVLYEICNEPNGNTTWSEIKAYAEEVIPIIREHDENAVILVGTPTWSQEVDKAAADPITEYKNIMYTLHFYAATHKDSLRNTMTAAVDAGLPVFVSEYGICDASGNGNIDIESSEKWISTMNEYGISYVAWNLSNKDETSSMIKSGCSKVNGYTKDDLSESGKWIYDMLNREGTSKSQQQPDVTQSAATQEQNANESINFKKGDIDITAEYKGGWEADGKYCYQYNVILSNKSSKDIEGWNIEIPFSGDISLSQGWCGNFTTDSSVLKISPLDFNTVIPANGTVSDIGFIIMGDENLRMVE